MRHNKQNKKTGFTIGELLFASSIAILVVGGAFALWFMTQDAWVGERAKSESLQELQVSIERIKREMQMSDGSKMVFYSDTLGSHDAVSLAIALDDGRSDTGYDAAEDGDGFLEQDSGTLDPTTGVMKIYWDKTVIYHVYNNGSEDELRRTDFYPRDNSLTAAERQTQLDTVVSLGTGNDASVSNSLNWQNTRAIFKAKSISFEVAPKLREFDGYSSTTERTESLIDFGSAILTPGYHTIEFKVIGKNALSSGYAMGIDSLKFTPPGSTREGENYIGFTHPDASAGISASSGDAVTSINMHDSPFGLWSADYYLNYGANAVNDYITLRFYYDRWYETTFLDGVADNAVIEFSNTDGAGGTSGNAEWLVRLEGNQTTWLAADQANSAITEDVIPAVINHISYRNIVRSNFTSSGGRLVSIKFRSGLTKSLTIKEAYIIQRDDSAGGSDLPYDGSPDMPSIPITFTNCDLDTRNLGQAPLPIPTGSGVTIGANGWAWSNWIELRDNSSVAFNLDKTKDYLISLYVETDLSSAQAIAEWLDPNLDVGSGVDEKHSFTIQGAAAPNYAATRQWSAAGEAIIENLSVLGIEEVYVRYVDSGSLGSQVFDTGIANPSYSTMKWASIINSPDAALQIRVRSSGSKAALEADGDWSSIPGQVFSIGSGSGSTSVAGIGAGRYVQFKAQLTSSPDYDESCVLKDISIYWPGNTSLVDVSGQLTKRPNYGIFTVEIDGEELTKGYVVTIAAESDLTMGKTINRSITAEVEPRNTNK